MNKQPLLFFCIFIISGIVLRELLPLSDNIVYLLFALAVLLVLSLLSRKIFLLRFKNFFILFGAFSLGIFLHHFGLKEPLLPEVDKTEVLVFKMDKKLNSNEKNRRYETTVWKSNKKFKCIFTIPRTEKELDFRHFYKAKVYLNRTEPPKNDYQFDYAKYLSRQKIYYQAYVPQGYGIAENKNLSLREKINQKRQDVLDGIDGISMGKKSREFLKGIILADRTEMDAVTVSDFSKTGLAHILAISGSHIAVIFGIIYFIFLKIFPSRLRKYGILCSLLFIWCFALFIGFGNSVVRSCIMLSVYFIYVLLQRKPDLLHAMALAALLILFYDTHQLFDVGFQLSFVAVFGIFWLNQPILKYFPRPKNRVQRFLMNVVTVTFAAQIATLPLVLYYFHQFSYISFLANLVIVPLSEIIIVFSLFMTVIIAFGFNFQILNDLYDWLTTHILSLIHWFSGFDKVFFKNIPMSFAEVAVLMLCVYLLRFVLVKFSIRNLLRLGYTLLFFMLLHYTLNYYFSKKEEVLVHHLFKQKAFSVKDKEKVYFWIPANSDRSRVEKYIIDPYLTSRRTTDAEIKILPPYLHSIKWKDKIYQLE